MERFNINKSGYGRGLQIMLRTSSKELINIFGTAQKVDSDKIKRMWGLKIDDIMFTVYDYNYHPKKSDEVCYWHVGMWSDDESYDYYKIRRTVLKALKEMKKQYKSLKVIDQVADYKHYLRTGKMTIY